MPADLQVIQALTVTAELMGKEFSSPAAARMLAEDLADFPVPAVVLALTRCRRELRTFPTLADIIARIDDGRPGPEEAWAMIPQDEAGSVVWTDEMAEAFGVARSLLDDPVAARMAFRETYLRLLTEARTLRRPVRWTPSLGQDPSQREYAVLEAERHGRISAKHAASLLPESKTPHRLGMDVRKLLQEMPK